MCLMEPGCPRRSQTCFLHPLSNMWLLTSTLSSPQLSECNSLFTGNEINTEHSSSASSPSFTTSLVCPGLCAAPQLLTEPLLSQKSQQSQQGLKFLPGSCSASKSLPGPSSLDSAPLQSSAKRCCWKLKGDKYLTKKPKKIVCLS